MKWFMNMKISAKLISGFIIVAFVAVIVGAIGVVNIKSISKSDTELYENMTVPISQIGEISTAFQNIRVNVRDMILASDPSVVKSNQQKMMQKQAEIEKNLKEFDKTILSDKMRGLYTDLIAKYNTFKQETVVVMGLAIKNKDAETIAIMSATGKSGIASKALQDAIDKVMAEKLANADQKSKDNSAKANSSTILMIIAIIVGAIIAIALGVFLSKIISNPMKILAGAADKLAIGDIDVNIKSKTKDEIGLLMGSFAKMVENIKGQSEIAEKIAEGNLKVEVIPKSDQDVLGKSLKLVVETLQKLVAEAEMLTKAAVEGKLDTRGNGDAFKGGYKEIVTGVNKTLDSVIGPLNVAAEYVDRISKGDIPPKITESYSGDFNEIKNNLNNCIDTMSGLLSETDKLIKATQDGKLDTRGNDKAFAGGWGTLVSGVNDLINAFVGPINVTAEYVDRISKGDIPPKISDTYYGDFNEIKNNLNNCIDTMSGLLTETDKLIKATQAGQLSTRGDAKAFEGGWSELVGGVNNLIEAFVAPINVTADYVDRISKGNLPQKITDVYYGDFNQIKNNLNNCIDNINALVVDANMLAVAAVEGRLDTRADATKHSGEYRKIVEGVNKTLDEVIRPVKEAGAVLKEMANGNLQLKVKGEYKGDNAEIKNALNETIDSLASYINEISEVLGEMANSNLDLVINTDFRGDFAKIKDALNLIISSFNEVFTDINNSSDQVASGSRQVSDGSQALAQGATEQASSVEELTASITQVAAQTKENAVNANQANELALTAKENAEQGNEHMNGMLGSMKEINESSSNISKIIKVIDDIAFQTNILALNAAVEAARAGQHGKGFAVVAEEVRNLAARSANAAKETTALIEGSIKKVEAGTQIANDTARALIEIVGGVTKAATLVGDIASASNQQASAIAQINKGIEQVSRVVQTNSATAEESAAASEELSSQADLLKQMISKFRLRRNSNSSRYILGENDMSRMGVDGRKSMSQGYSEAAVTSTNSKKSRISLSDNDFGKY